MKQMNLFTKQKQTHRHRKQISDYQKKKEGRGGIICMHAQSLSGV